MILPIYSFPIDILTPKHPGFWPSGGVKTGPTTISGLQDFDNLDGGPIWRARLSQIPIHCRSAILLAQAIQSLAQSGVGLFDVPKDLYDRALGQDAVSGDDVPEVGSPHSDLTPFSDATLYMGSDFLAGAGPGWTLMSSTVEIVFADEAHAIMGGEEFSVVVAGKGARLHRIMRVVSVGPTSSVVEISPPLRSDVPEGAALNFERPSCVMRMTNAEAFLQDLSFNRQAEITAEFEEVLF